MSHTTHILIIPPTTAYTIVFPQNGFTGQFDNNFYSPMLTDGRAHPEEINRVLRELESTVKPLSTKLKSSVCCYILTIFLSVFAFIPFMIFLTPANVTFLPIGIFGFFFLMIGATIMFIKRIKNYNLEIRRVSQGVIDRANQEFSYKGLRWVLPMHYPRWVELWKDYYSQGQMAQPIYMAPNTQAYPNYAPGDQMGAAQPQYQQNFYPGYQNNTGYMPPNQV